jgi:hypothetical protein
MVLPMKRTNTKLELKRRLELLRTTVRELTPAQLQQVNGGNATAMCISKCCEEISYA